MVKIFKRFYRFLLRYKKRFMVFIAVLLVASVLANLNPYFLKLLIDSAPSRNYQRLIAVLLVFVGVRILAGFLDTLSHYLGDRVLVPAAKDARLAVFRYIQDLDFAFHVDKNTGSLISAFRRGDGAFFELFFDIHQNIIYILVSLLVAIFFFSRITPAIALVLLLIFVINTALSWYLIKINMEKRRSFNKSEDEISGIITDNLLNYETVKFFAQEEKETRRLKDKFKDWMSKLYQYSDTFRLMDFTIGTLSNLGLLFIFWITISKLIKDQITLGDFAMVAAFISGFYYQFFDLLYRLRNIAKRYVDIQRYFAVLDNEIQVKDPVKPVKVKEIRGEICFHNLNFSYPSNKQAILRNIDLSIQEGESIALVGRSGAGKTTLIKLLLRFYDLSKGKISLDGIDIKDFSKSQLRSFIGVVPQEPILFNNTIGYNIAYGVDKAMLSEIIEAAKMANLHDFIKRLPLKYKTEVGERGIKLSGGQKQRLAIARMLLTDPKIIVFDEATSNLDSESERLIQDSLWKIAKKRTVLIIAHRFSTVRRADKIIVMNEGQIVEAGSHKSLIRKKEGLYKYLWQLQAQVDLRSYDSDLLK